MMEDEGRIWVATGESEEAAKWLLISLFPQEAHCFHIVQKVEDIQFNKGYPPFLWTKGRVFSRKAELRWERTEAGGFRLLLLSEADLSLGEPWRLSERRWEVRGDTSLILWGDKRDGDPSWIETRIPRPLDYPLPTEASGKAMLVGVHYLSEGIVQFTRLKEVHPYGSEA